MQNVYIKEVEFAGLPGGMVADSVKEVFEWFYTGKGKDVQRCTLRHLNGVKVLFEREGV